MHRDISRRIHTLLDFWEVKLVIYLFRLNYLLPQPKPVPRSGYALLQPFLQKQARKLHAVIGDGNCLFRALSHQLTGDEQSHITLRKIIVDFEALNPQVFARLVVAINEREFLNT